MNKICTSVEQSKRLIRLGIDISTADMRYGYIAPYDFSDMYDGDYDKVPYPKGFLKKNPDFSENQYDGELPAWSLAALLNVLESEINEKEGESYQLNIEKYGSWWNVCYRKQYDEANASDDMSDQDFLDVEDAEDYNRKYGNMNKYYITISLFY